jgi:hypothetical protein
MRNMDMESNERSTVMIVEDLVLVMRSILSRRKLKKAIKGSRCWTSALTAKRMSGEMVSTLEGSDGTKTSTIVVAVV